MHVQSLDIQDSRLATLYQVSSQLGQSLKLDDVLAQVMDSIIELTGAERGYIVVRHEQTQQLETAVARNVDHQSIPSQELEICQTILEETMTTAQGVLTNNAQNDERFSHHQSIIEYQLRSIMSAPLQVRNKVFGAVYVDNPLLNGVFKTDDLNVLLTFANQAAVAIENARLFTQTDQALARCVDELSLFQKIDQQLNNSLELNDVLQTVLDWAVSTTKAEIGSIGLMVAEGGAEFTSLQIELVHGTDTAVVDQKLPVDHPFIAQIMAKQTKIKNSGSPIESAIHNQAAQAQLIVPIIQRGKVNGVINLESQQEDCFSADDEQFIERLANKAAVAIHNAQLFEDVRRANQAKSDFISLVSHELRLPMTSIKGYTDLMIGGMVGELNEQQTQFLGVIKRNLGRMNALISDLADIYQLESGRLHLEKSEMDVGQVINDVVDSFKGMIDSKDQTVAVDIAEDLDLVYADSKRVNQILTNLVSNAHKYGGNGSTILIKANQNQPKWAEIAVIDSGYGISEADQEKVFTQFFRSAQVESREEIGWGLGLSIVKRLVEAQGGTIECKSILGEGSTFTFTIPTVFV